MKTFPRQAFRSSHGSGRLRRPSRACRRAWFLLGTCLPAHIAAGAQPSTRSPSPPTTNIAMLAKVHRGSVQHFGINLGNQNFYDSGQLLRNLAYRNPGFEAESWQSILRCKAATATSCTDGNQYAVWPENFLKDAHFQFLSGPAAGLSGTLESSTPATYPESGVSIHFSALPHPPAAGDFVLVRFHVAGGAEKGWWADTLNSGATFTTEFRDLSPDSPGKQALRIHASGANQAAHLDSYFDTYVGRSFLRMNGRYTLAFRAKGMGGSDSLTVGIHRNASRDGIETLFPGKLVHLSNTWKTYSYDWTASEDGTLDGPVDLSFSVAGADVLLDDVSLTAAAASDNPTAFRNEVVKSLRDLQPGILRYSQPGTDAAATLDNMIAPPFARLRAGYSTQATMQEQIPVGLPEFLALCKAVHAEPWYSLPATVTPEETANLIEYLGGAPTTPYGRKRAAAGQIDPWTTVFPVTHLEFGNELWNAGTFYGAAMADPAAYGKRAARIFAAARSSAAFVPARFDLILGSLAANPWWTGQELANSAHYDTVAVAPYLFDKLIDSTSDEAIFGSMFAEPESLDSLPTGSMAQQAKAALSAEHPARLAVYEVNLGTDQGSAAQSVVNAVAPSLGAGLAVVEHMLLMLRDLGITAQATYALTGYANKFRNPQDPAELAPLWGTVVDLGGPTNRRRPLFYAQQLADRAILSKMLEAKLTGADPVWKQDLSPNNDVALDHAHALQVFAFGQGNRRSLIVFNLDRQKALRVTFSGDAPKGSVQVSQLTSAHPSDTNEQKDLVRPASIKRVNFNATRPYVLPPVSMTTFAWTSSQPLH